MKKIFWILVIVAVALLIWFGLKKDYAEISSNDPIRVGGLFILTGPVASGGVLQHQAAQLAVEKINSEGGINGRPLEIIEEDTAYDPKTSVSAYQKLKLNGIKYFITDGSPVAAAVRPLVVEDGNVLVVAAATTPAYNDGNNLTCRIALTAENFGPAVSDMLLENVKGNKIVILAGNNEYGKGMVDNITRSLNEKGGEVLSVEFYDDKSGDFRTNMTKLSQFEEADALFVVNPSNTVEPMLSQIKEMGWDKPILSDYYTIQNPNLKNLSLAENITFADYEYVRGENDGDSKFIKEYKNRHKEKFGADPVFLSAAAYDTIMVLADALRNTDDIDNPQIVADYISKMKGFDGVTGKLTFDDDCEVQRNIVVRNVKDGKFLEI